MASMQSIKRRIKSVNGTRQITRAMNLVASSKLSKAKESYESSKPFFESITKVISSIVKDADSVFTQKREVKNTGVIVITGDRGLCGGYNINVCKRALELEEKGSTVYFAVGSRGYDYLSHKSCNFSDVYTGISENPDYENAREIGERVTEMFVNNQLDRVYIVYTEYISTISNEPRVMQLLPVLSDDFEKSESTDLTMTLYEPSEESVLAYVIPKYVNAVIYGALTESAVCELTSRMTAMDSATDNASQMLDSLNLHYNRARQGAITQELTEIVSGSNALE